MDDVQQVAQQQNPWHQTGTVPRSLALPTQRPLARLLWRRLLDRDMRRYQLVLGPRRVGKTTVLYQTVERLLADGVEPQRIWWLRMDHPVLMRLDLGALVRLVVESSGATPDQPAFVMLDELVYAESWDLWLKTFYDEQWPVQIAATSSAAAALSQGLRESGVGRWEEQYLTPCSFTEFLNLSLGQQGPDPMPEQLGWSDIAQPTLAETIRALPPGPSPHEKLAEHRLRFMLVGGFPELLGATTASPSSDDLNTDVDIMLRSQQVLRSDAVDRAVYKDIPQVFGVDSPMMLERLLYVLADQVAGLLSPTNICGDLGISVPTFERYLTYLQQAFLVFTLPNYSRDEKTVQRRGRKLYFVDGAVRNAALQSGIALIVDPLEQGVLLENLVSASLRTLTSHSGVRLHHWRHSNSEVDLIYNDPREPMAFEVASSPRHSRAGLRAFIKQHPRFHGSSYLVAPNTPVVPAQSNREGIGTIPLDTFLVAVGAQAEQALTARLRPQGGN